MKNTIALLLILFISISCKKDNQLEKRIDAIKIDITVERFDKLFAETTPSSLSELKAEYPFLFPEKYTDSFWIAKLNDTLERQLFDEASKIFPDFDEIELEIEDLFKHLKYYFPEFTVPRIITNTSLVDYRNKTIVTDTIVLIAIDTYFGTKHHFYEDIHKYIRQNFNKEQIVVDLAGNYAKKYIYQKQNRTLLEEMVYFGKQLYFKDVMLPNKSDAEKIGYTKSQFDWAEANESQIWRYFVERELLFSTDAKLPNRFINPAPFSKFNLEEIDNESPGQIGRYMGWQIVRAYMEHNDVDLKQMLITDADEIFNNSKFKPRK